MNILPKKRWHVRTKDNIARVRKDEALAAEEEKKKQLRIQIAEREKRREELRKRARERTGVQISDLPKTTETHASSNEHVNLFYELEQNEIVSDKSNKEYVQEKQLEKEKYEKQIGYLTYLGQDTNEITGNVSWYNKPREELHAVEEKEIAKKQKIFEDPLEDIRKYLGCEGIQKIKDDVKSEKKVITRERCDSKTDVQRKKQKKKHKKHKKHKKKHKRRYSSSESESEESQSKIKGPSSVDLESMRAERIRREREERKRANELFAKLNGVTVKKENNEREMEETSQRYNSQFNPHLAKQNYVCR